MAHFQLPQGSVDSGAWGPPGTGAATVIPEEFQQIPFAPFSKSERIGRIADWNTGGANNDERSVAGTVQGRSTRNARGSAPAWGAQTSAPANTFAYFHAEDEASFSVVDNAKSGTLRRPTASGALRGGRGGAAAQGRTSPFVRGAPAPAGPSGRPSRGGRTPVMANVQRGARRQGGYRDWERTQRKAREASITVGPEWEQLSELDFSRLQKLRLEVDEPEAIASYGTLYAYDRAYDRVSVRFERPLQPRDRAHYSATTSEDPVIQEIAEDAESKSKVFITDSILALLMCAPRSVYPWDIVITKSEDGKLFFDKRPNGPFDFVTVNENANEPPVELNDPVNGPNPETNTRARINTPGALSLEATFVNENFGFQVCDEKKTHSFKNPNPFHQAAADDGQLASCGYRYRRFNLSTDEADPVEVVVRTELNAFVPGATPKSKPAQYITIRTLNEFDPRAAGAGGAPDWRLRLDQSRGAVVATEMKNNSFKLARFAVQSILAGADNMKLGYISRANTLDPYRHVILGTSWFKPKELAAQMAYSLANGWGIVRTVIDMVRDVAPGRYILVKDPNRPVLRFFKVPFDFDQQEEEEEDTTEDADAQDMADGDE
ncbi:hypothetical protein MVES1_001647 [Malassezia vespertilionis]|uniref:Eukaryotic translation initiation factor 3 subunit D n=1 Tax=Malassezia vespertilionis TaxID=2020962 RepID=A0A2N1JCN1_9BASI|nr:uncharacterized protein MVES1_001647 [Malassezia vespertilionis]PKI84282.1 hypothetical protein MVES_001549 [Malassezia vespertilionis]WFD06302.1 hypothetical protein MVES1_001647 [Malassezia vespertilionis]